MPARGGLVFPLGPVAIECQCVENGEGQGGHAIKPCSAKPTVSDCHRWQQQPMPFCHYWARGPRLPQPPAASESAGLLIWRNRKLHWLDMSVLTQHLLGVQNSYDMSNIFIAEVAKVFFFSLFSSVLMQFSCVFVCVCVCVRVCAGYY